MQISDKLIVNLNLGFLGIEHVLEFITLIHLVQLIKLNSFIFKFRLRSLTTEVLKILPNLCNYCCQVSPLNNDSSRVMSLTNFIFRGLIMIWPGLQNQITSPKCEKRTDRPPLHSLSVSFQCQCDQIKSLKATLIDWLNRVKKIHGTRNLLKI